MSLNDNSFEKIVSELSQKNDDPRRPVFYGDYSNFLKMMNISHRRFPIMSKKPVDLYLLYNQVCERGGVVQVIKNKEWPQVIKYLGLTGTSSSASFTLRKQYTRYLYEYECTKKQFSTADKLNAVVNANKARGKNPPNNSNSSNSLINASLLETSEPTSRNHLALGVNSQNTMSSSDALVNPSTIEPNHNMFHVTAHEPSLANIAYYYYGSEYLRRVNRILQLTIKNINDEIEETEKSTTSKRPRDDDENPENDTKKPALMTPPDSE